MRAVVDATVTDHLATYTDPRWQLYLGMHGERYRLLAAQLVELAARRSRDDERSLRVLDIGPRFEVDLIQRLLPRATVDTLGINPGPIPLRAGGAFHEFDLNETWDESRRPSIGPYGLIVMAEVLEHLHTAPSVVLPWLASLLEPGGYLLLQTPNAVGLRKRLRMLAGVHPYEPLTTDRDYPGHVRESTIAELVAEGRRAGLEVDQLRTANYFRSTKPSNRVYHALERVLPPSLRAGITVVYRRP